MATGTDALIANLTKELTKAYDQQARCASRAIAYGQEIMDQLNRPVEQQYGLTVYLSGNPVTDFNNSREAVEQAQQRLMNTMLTLDYTWEQTQLQMLTAKMLIAERYQAYWGVAPVTPEGEDYTTEA
mgnify:CR=1 FL=1